MKRRPHSRPCRWLRGDNCILDLDQVHGWRLREHSEDTGGNPSSWPTHYDVAAYIGVESFSMKSFDNYQDASAYYERCISLWST